MLRLTPIVKNLIILNVIVFFFLNLIMMGILPISPRVVNFFVLHHNNYLGLWPMPAGANAFHPIQLVTSFFSHLDLFHILFNMLALASLGTSMEMVMGPRRFLRMYLFAGVFAGLMITFFDPMYGGVVLGASTAISGVLAAYAVQFPSTPLSFFFLPPISARKLVIGVAVISAVLVGVQMLGRDMGGLGRISHFGHLTGIVGGVLYFWLEKRLPFLRN
ncbi:MAG: rhomboid family intramembrane serine protease [Bacteroidetes bacterium]|nr:MAG: rhomboid family intramembrane serine protease [Bacteroidota bacterium]